MYIMYLFDVSGETKLNEAVGDLDVLPGDGQPATHGLLDNHHRRLQPHR